MLQLDMEHIYLVKHAHNQGYVPFVKPTTVTFSLVVNFMMRMAILYTFHPLVEAIQENQAHQIEVPVIETVVVRLVMAHTVVRHAMALEHAKHVEVMV